MSLSLSIFQKVCPGCASSVSVDAAQCECGHLFESEGNSVSPLEASLRDEELYEGYLAARAEQAHLIASTADQALAEESDNPDLKSAAALAREVARSIDHDLAEQRKKIAAIQQVVLKSKPVTPPPAERPETVIPAVVADLQKSIVAEDPPMTAPPMTAKVAAKVEASPAVESVRTPVADKPVTTKIATVTATPASPAVNAASTSVKPKPAAATSKPAKADVTSSWKASTAQKAANVLATIKNAKVREAISQAKKSMDAAKVTTAPTAPPALSSVVLSQPEQAPDNVLSQAPTSAFRMEQAAKAEKIMEARKTVETKECPNCTANVPVNTTRCQCGFAFISGGTELPSLTLCTGDFTALRNSFMLNLRSN